MQEESQPCVFSYFYLSTTLSSYQASATTSMQKRPAFD